MSYSIRMGIFQWHQVGVVWVVSGYVCMYVTCGCVGLLLLSGQVFPKHRNKCDIPLIAEVDC